MTNVLIVDDEKSIRVSLREFLAADGHNVDVAADAREALEFLADHDYDVVVSDIVLPRTGGIELLKTIREAAPHAQVIMITGDPTVDTAAEALRSGALDYLTKPVGKDAILRAVGNAARVKTLNDEKRRLEQAIHEQLEQLETQNAELREAATFREEVEHITRHDLKSPLSLIIGAPQLILKRGDNLTDKQREYLRMIEQSGRRMLGMINLSLELFRIEQGMYELHPEPVDILGLLDEVLKHLEPLSRVYKASSEVVFDNRPPTPTDALVIQGEKSLCYSMLSNLVKNALEASPHGGLVRIELGSGDKATVAIHNQGAVPLDIRQRFFHKHATSGKRDGTGLGTYSARLMAEAQGGSIELLTSGADRTTLLLSFPIHHPSSGGVRAPQG